MSHWRLVRAYETGADYTESDVQSNRISVACYNIAHGRGLADSNWDDDKRERETRLERIAKSLRELDADVVVLNEVDFDSSWSRSQNQARFIAERAGYRYVAEQRNLDFRILFYKWRFGNAILSKFPIDSAEIVDLPGFRWWETLLAGKKRGMICTIDSQLGPIQVAAVHLSPRSESLRVRSVELLCEQARSSELPFVMAGDFNSTPPDFPRSMKVATDKNAIQVLIESELFQTHRHTSPAKENFTFPTNEPDRTIDWIVWTGDFDCREYRVTAVALSDHLPVCAELDRKD